MAPVNLKTLDELKPQVKRVLSQVFAQLEALFPDAELHHIGATAIPGALTKGDVDVLLRVSGTRFPAVVDVLKRHFTIKQPGNWTSAFASFGDDTSFELPLGVQVVVKNAKEDFLLFLRDYFVSHRDALAEYNRLKTTHAVEGPEGYWKAKDRFLAKILASR
jgi:GrpB-like predicted nucleotidyltransferase (UPF0157 family)